MPKQPRPSPKIPKTPQTSRICNLVTNWIFYSMFTKQMSFHSMGTETLITMGAFINKLLVGRGGNLNTAIKNPLLHIGVHFNTLFEMPRISKNVQIPLIGSSVAGGKLSRRPHLVRRTSRSFAIWLCQEKWRMLLLAISCLRIGDACCTTLKYNLSLYITSLLLSERNWCCVTTFSLLMYSSPVTDLTEQRSTA